MEHLTKLSDEELREILEFYNLGQVKYSSFLASGIQSDNYLVKTTNGKFLIKAFTETKINSTSLQNILKVQEILASNGVRAPRPIKTRSGKFYIRRRGTKIAIQTFIEGKPSRTMTNRLLMGMERS
jgi:homoserine kinase type II